MNIPFNISIQAVVFGVAFFLAFISGPLIIPALARLKFGQTVRDDGPATHFKKTGTPTMGGLIFLVPVLLISVYFQVSGKFPQILPLALVTIGFGAIGFIDDFIKVVKKSKDGLYANQKMLGLILVSAAFSFYIASGDTGTDIVLPFLGMESTFDLKWLYVPFNILFLISVTNAVNITDGVDGLAAGVTLIIAVFFTLVAMTSPEWDHVKIFSSVLAGGCLGFLVFNIHPAKVFMGDTGSLALGGAVGAIAILMKLQLILFIVGIIYVVETLSVILQVGSFKLRGKRIFKMAPIHHHFELSGWKETRVVNVFWSITVVFCAIGLLALRFKFF